MSDSALRYTASYPLRLLQFAIQAKEVNNDEETKSLEEDEKLNEDIILNRRSPTKEQKAPRSSDGELILRRREIHSGRSLTVSTVEWSVAEKKAVPTSALEGWMVWNFRK